MRIAVTGASGNVGTALARSLLAHGHEVVGISRRPPGTDSRYAAVQWHAIDVTDPDAQTRLRAVFEGADAVVHLVWGFQPTHDRDYLERLDIGGTRRVIAAALAAGVPHLVHQSSLGVYSPAPPDDRPRRTAATRSRSSTCSTPSRASIPPSSSPGPGRC
jgi:nucleoside-diphosphate-sugar epimerase